MMMIVTYPWPVASAHVGLTGPQPQHSAVSLPELTEDTIDQHGRRLEDIVRWTSRERLRLQWYGVRIAIGEVSRRSSRNRQASPVTK